MMKRNPGENMKHDQNNRSKWETIIVVAGMLILIAVLSAEGALAQKSAALFYNLSIVPAENQFTINGFLYDQDTNEPIVSQSIDAYCNGKRAISAVSDDKGGFTFVGKYNQCALNTKVLLKTIYDDNEYSLTITMPGFVFLEERHGANSNNDDKQSNEGSSTDIQSQESALSIQGIQESNPEPITKQPSSAMVPEFSLPTLALAIIISGLGLALLRKHR